jgi:hypothetical protein
MTELVEVAVLLVAVTVVHGGMPLHLWKTHGGPFNDG